METFVMGGTFVEIRHEHNMYRADIQGVHYCAPELDILKRIIERFNAAVLPQPEPEPVIPVADLLYQKFKNGKLEERQDARKQLIDLAKNGDELAMTYLDELPHGPTSMAAKFFAKSIGKDFDDVTMYDLTANINDIVFRNQLFAELALRYGIKC